MKCSRKPKSVEFFQVPRRLWRKLKRLLPPVRRQRQRGRPPADVRAVWNGIWYVLWTGCQWKAVKREWFGVSSSVLHQRFQLWQQTGLFARLFQRVVRFYARERRIGWQWQALDSKSCPAPLGGAATGPNPTDRAKAGSKIHLLVDQRGAPLAVCISGANYPDHRALPELVLSMIVERPTLRQHLCADRGYDYPAVHQFLAQAGYHTHIKHRRLRNEPPASVVVPADHLHPARRWVVERTFNWLVKRRSLRVRWAKKSQNWLPLVQFACADILCNMALYPPE